MGGGLRLSLRIARREAMRHKGRSILSIALLALPILGVSLGASAWDTTQLSELEEAEQFLGENDAFIEPAYVTGPIEQTTWTNKWPHFGFDEDEVEFDGDAPDAAAMLAALPEGTRIAPYSQFVGSGSIQVMTDNGIGGIDTLGYDLSNPLYEQSNLVYTAGGAPEGDQIVLSSGAASYLGLGPGDQLETLVGDDTVEYDISGVVELPTSINARFAMAAHFADEPYGYLVDTPDTFTYEDALALNEIGVTVWSKHLVANPPESDRSAQMFAAQEEATYVITALLVTVLIIEVVLLSGPAFSISVRSRQREFALLSASGATPAQIRNTVLAGGALFGVIAAIVAITVGVLAVWAATPLLETLVGHRSAGLRVMPWLQVAIAFFAIGTGLLTALSAALSASRVNVVAALAGRVPRRAVRKRWAILGLALIGAGIAAGLAGLTLWALPLLAAAVVLLQLGIVACTPITVAWIAKLGRWLPLTPRMALRDAGRNRGSTAPAISAVMGVVAASIAFSMVVAAEAQRAEESMVKTLPQDQIMLSMYTWGEPVTDAEFATAVSETERSLERHLGEFETVPLVNYAVPPEQCDEGDEWATCELRLERPEQNRCPYWDMEFADADAEREAVHEMVSDDERCNETINRHGIGGQLLPVADDHDVVAAYTRLSGDELDAAAAHLEQGGVLVSDEHAIDADGNATLRLVVYEFDDDGTEIETVRYRTDPIPAMAVDEDLLGYGRYLLGPAAAEAAGLAPDTDRRDFLIETDEPLDTATREAIDLELFAPGSVASVERNIFVSDYTDPFTFYLMLAVAGLAGVIALGATAVSTGLIISEARRDMTTLGAVGATPGLRKRLAMWQTLVIAWLGAILGTAAGGFGYVLIRAALNREPQSTYPTDVLYGWELPWANFGIALLAVPLVAMLGAALFTRSRLPSERRLT